MLFKILHGNSSNISLDVTPFHEGWCYVTYDGYFYVDLNIGTQEEPNNQRIKLNAKEAEKLIGYDISTILNSSDIEIPTSKAVLEAIEAAKADAVLKDLTVLSEAQAYTNEAIEAVQTELSNQDTVILSEAQAYTDEAIAAIPAAPSKTSQLTNDSGFITTETDPTVPAWAKADTKPVYTAEEVGALSADTEIPSIEGLATEDYVDTAVESAKVEAANQDTVILAEAQAYTDTQIQSVQVEASNQDAVVLSEAQDFTNRATSDVIRHSVQTLTEEQKAQVRANIGVSEGGSGSPAIIDVIELPTENIQEGAFYRVLKPRFVYGADPIYTKCHVVSELPETGEVCHDTNTGLIIGYYNLSDGNVYGYVTDELAEEADMTPGWITIDEVIPQVHDTFMGVTINIQDAIDSGLVHLLLEYEFYHYQNGWSRLHGLGKTGEIPSAEVFNDYISNTASGDFSHAEGYFTTASGYISHTEGCTTTASGPFSHAEGWGTTASGEASHAEGNYTASAGYASHAEGDSTTASGFRSHAEGYRTTAYGEASHAEGFDTIAFGPYSHAEGVRNESLDIYITGDANATTYTCSSVTGLDVGYLITCGTNVAKIIGFNTTFNRITVSQTLSESSIDDLLATVYFSGVASGGAAHVEGRDNIASGYCSHAEGDNTTASGHRSHAEGDNTTASGEASHAEGFDTIASGQYSHAEGRSSRALGVSSHAEGADSYAKGDYSHAEGSEAYAIGVSSHAEGMISRAEGDYSHAEGSETTASGEASHAEGFGTTASRLHQHVQGTYNIEDTEGEDGYARGKYAHIVGNGTSHNNRSNAHTLDWDGNAWFQGNVYVGGSGQDDDNSKELATKEYVDNKLVLPAVTEADNGKVLMVVNGEWQLVNLNLSVDANGVLTVQ